LPREVAKNISETSKIGLLDLTCRIGKDEAGSPHPLGWG
jgi:hypothetical protein